MDATADEAPVPPKEPRSVDIIDCTLRDGEQTPGVWFTVEEKVELARLLAEAGVAVLDAGFPASSGADLEAMQEMRRIGVRASLGATARPLSGDITAARKACADEVFLFMPTSDLRLRETLGITREQARETMRSGVDEVCAEGMAVNVVFEDATRSSVEYMARLIDDACDPGKVRRLVLADSVGCASPDSMRALIGSLRDRLDPHIELCTHTHNDYGLATANTLAGVEAGARAITCTVNGIGERAGNADLAECVAALTHLCGVGHTVDPLRLPELSRLVERVSGIHMAATKPVTGFNVYRHESGTHVSSMLKDTRSYETLSPSWTGSQRSYVLGKHSGAALIRHVLGEAGLAGEGLGEVDARRLLALVKETVARSGKESHDAAYTAKEEFTATALAGVPADVVLAEYRRMRAEDEA